MAELIVHLPGLERSPPSALPDVLLDALRSARWQRCNHPLAQVLGSAPVPAAGALSALGIGDEAAESAYWLRFDVVRMIPDLTAVWIERPLSPDFRGDSYAELKRELAALFESEGLEGACRFHRRFGLLALERAPDCRFPAIDEIQGERLDTCLPAGPDAPRWHRLITASQILFHRFRALDRPDQVGAGLWFWGGGDRSAGSDAGRSGSLRVADPFDSAMARGLARWLGAELETAGSLTDRAPSRRILVGLPQAHPAPGEGLERLVSDWIEPALASLRRGGLERLTVAGSAGCWHTGRWSRWALWRKNIQGLSAPGDA